MVLMMNKQGPVIMLLCFLMLSTISCKSSALTNLEENVSKDPNNIELKFKLAGNYNLRNMPEKALEQYKEILKVDPKNPDAFYNIGYYYYQQSQNKLAFSNFEKAIEFGMTGNNIYQQTNALAKELRHDGDNSPQLIKKEISYGFKALEQTKPDTDYGKYTTNLIILLNSLHEIIFQQKEYRELIFKLVSENSSIITKEKDPYNYFMLQTYLGDAYRVSDSRTDKEKAAKYYEDALSFFNSKDYPNERKIIVFDLEQVKREITYIGE